MAADKGKKMKVVEKGEEENAEQIDGDLVLSIEKLQEIQDELEKVHFFYLHFTFIYISMHVYAVFYFILFLLV